MKVFTTGQVAKICKVAPRTVSKWFDSGRLKGYRIPGSQDRRIPREYLIRFLKEHGMPLGDLEDEAMAKVLIVGQDQVLIENLKRELPLDRSFKVAVAASGFEAGIQAESFHPDCIIVDFSIGRVEALQICQNLRRNTEYADTILIALLPDDGSSTSFDRSSINETFKKPFDAALLGRTSADADRCPQGTGPLGFASTDSIHSPIKRINPSRLDPRGGSVLGDRSARSATPLAAARPSAHRSPRTCRSARSASRRAQSLPCDICRRTGRIASVPIAPLGPIRTVHPSMAT